MTVRELITTWGFDIDDKPLRELDEHIKGVKETVMHLGELILGEGASLFGLAESTADAGVGFKRTAEEVGTTTQRLQELNYAAKQWDMSPEAVQQGLRHLSRMAVEAAQGSTEAIRSLSMAGVTSFRDSNGQMLRSDQLLEQVARHFKGMANDSMKAGLSMQVFGRGGTELMPLLNRMGPEFEAMAKQGRDLGYVMGDQAIEASEKFKESTNLVRAMVMGLRNTIGVALMPAIEGMVNDVIKWYQANREVINSQIVEFAHQLADAVRGAFQMVTLIANAVMVLSSALGGLGNVLKIITALFVGWTALNIVVLLGSAAKAVRELAAAFTEMGISEAFATGGLSLILGGAAALAAGGLMYHAMNSGSTAGSPEGSAPVNFTGPGHGGSVSIRQEHTWNIHMPPGTTQEQADRLGREMDQRTAASMRGLAFAASSPGGEVSVYFVFPVRGIVDPSNSQISWGGTPYAQPTDAVKLPFDCTISEAPEFLQTPTESLTEEVKTITDHFVQKPLRIKVEAIISDTPLPGMPFAASLRGAQGAISSFAGGSSPSAKAYRYIRDTLWKAKAVFDFVGGYQIYTNVMVAEFRPIRTAESGSSLTFSMVLQQVLLVGSTVLTKPSNTKAQPKTPTGGQPLQQASTAQTAQVQAAYLGLPQSATASVQGSLPPGIANTAGSVSLPSNAYGEIPGTLSLPGGPPPVAAGGS